MFGAQLYTAHLYPLEEAGFRLELARLGVLFCALQLAWVRAFSHSHLSWLCLQSWGAHSTSSLMPTSTTTPRSTFIPHLPSLSVP